MAITCALAGFIAYLVVPASAEEASSDKSFDYLGSILGVAGLVLFNVAWNQAPIVGWGTPHVIVLLILGLLLLGAFFAVERKVSTPLVPFSAFSGKTGFVLGCISLGWSSFGIWVFYFWQFAEILRGYNPLAVTAQIVPAGISGLCAAVVSFLGAFSSPSGSQSLSQERLAHITCLTTRRFAESGNADFKFPYRQPVCY